MKRIKNRHNSPKFLIKDPSTLLASDSPFKLSLFSLTVTQNDSEIE